jgi:apolipoprotein N-acyltransferase
LIAGPGSAQPARAGRFPPWIRAATPALLSCLAGVAHTLSFAPFGLPALQPAALAVLIALVQRAPDWRRAARLGFVFGLGWFAAGMSWVYISMHDYGEMPAWMAVIATFALIAYLAAYPALAAAAAHRATAQPALRLLLAWPGAWALSEWLRGTLLGGLPWIASGYAHADGPLAGYAPIVGVYGLCLIAAVIAGAIVLLLQPRSRPMRFAALALALVLIAGGAMLRQFEWTRPAGAPLKVKLVQGNIPQDLKFSDGGTQLSVARYFPMMPDPPGEHSDLVVLPESAFPLPLNDLPADVQQYLLDFPREQHSALIFGTFLQEPGNRIYNSAVGLQADQPMQRYSKRHLVAFGEFVPFGFHWLMELVRIPIGDQDRGPPYQPPMQLAGQRIAVNICFEDLFGAEIVAAWHEPALEPTMLLNLSNLAWFNDSLALPQHLQIARMRALETGLPLLRATNTGATAIIDPHGRVLAQLPFLQAAALRGEVSGFRGRTPYVMHGDLSAMALALALLVASLAAGRGPTARARET